MPGSLYRRRLLVGGSAALIGAALPAFPAAAQGPRATGKPITIAQVVDMSGAQQDVSKDFLIGSRAAWQDINTKGGLRGRTVQHLSLEVDGTPQGMRAALTTLRDNASCVCLFGTAGDAAATQLVGLMRQEGLAIAHVAPWLQNASLDVDERTFPIFASRQDQIGHALKSLSVMGVQELGAVYASQREHGLFSADLERIASELKLRLQNFPSDGELVRLGQRLTPSTPAVLLFVGGTPELVQFTQGLERQTRQRYIVALADVNLQTMMQMGGGRNTPVIATQAVPMVTASLPIVRQYRETLSRLFDEPPTPLSLAGFIAARYAYEVLADIEAPTRASVLAGFQRRASHDVGGFRIAYNPQRRNAGYVTQSMLTQDGRVVG